MGFEENRQVRDQFTVTTIMGMPDGTDRAITTVISDDTTDDEVIVDRIGLSVRHLLSQRAGVTRRMAKQEH